MKFRQFNFLVIAVALLIVGCGHKQKVQELLQDGTEALDDDDNDRALGFFRGHQAGFKIGGGVSPARQHSRHHRRI